MDAVLNLVVEIKMPKSAVTAKEARSHFMKRKAAILIAPLLIALTAIPAAATQSAPDPIFLVKFVVNSTSGWTTVSMDGIAPFAQNASLLTGSAIPGFQYTCKPGYITMGRSTLDEIPATVEVMCLTLRGNQSGKVSISKGHNGYTEVTAYLYSSGSWSQFTHFLHEGVNLEEPYLNTRRFTIYYDQVYASPSCYATIEPVPANIRKSVYAFYYPWYLTPKGPSGEMFHCDGGYAHEPYIGRYDSMDEGVIEAHMRMARAAGIDGFIINFNGPAQKDERAVPTILRAADALNFPISFYECADRQLTSDDMIGELSYIIRNYSSHESFLKGDGMPVIFVFAASGWNRGPSFWSEVGEGLRGKGSPAYLIGDLGLPPDPRYAESFEGLHWYGAPNTTVASQAFDLYEKSMRLGLKDVNWDQAMALILQGRSLPLEEKFMAFTVEPGYDHTKIGGTEYLDRKGGRTYGEFWQTALSKDPDGILVCSWNEWHEGSEVEPSVEYGFAYLNLTRQYTSLYKGTSQPVTSSTLRVQTGMGDVVRYGLRYATLGVINDSPNIQAAYVNLSISLSGGLSLTRVNHSAFYAYVEKENARTYNVLIPLLKPGETIPFDITFTASLGKGSLSATATGYSPSGVMTTFSTTREVQVVHDRVVIDLVASNSRVEVGSEALINMSAHYEYDHQPFSGIIHLNDTLTKYSVDTYYYTASSISDDIYGLTDFTSNTVSIAFDRIIMSPIMETTAPGSIGVTARLSFESDGRPVDEAAITVNGAHAAETSIGTFQTTVATWNPLYQLNVTIERPGFSPQNITLSGYATGNMLLAIAAMMFVISTIIVMKVTRKHPVPPTPPPPPKLSECKQAIYWIALEVERPTRQDRGIIPKLFQRHTAYIK